MRPPHLTYERYLTEQWHAVREGMDATLANQSADVADVVRWVMASYVLVQFVRWGIGRLGGMDAVASAARAWVVVALLTNQAFYAGVVRDTLWEDIPNTLAGAVSGQRSVLAPATQFDVVSAMHENLVADVRRQNSMWTMSGISNMLNAWIGNASAQFWLMVMAANYMSGIKLMAIVIVLGMWLILFELFERTRGFAFYWFGVAAGLLCYQLASSVYMQIALRSQMTLLRNTRASAGSVTSIDEMAANLIHLGNMMFSDALTMMALSTICAVGGGAAGHAMITRYAQALPGSTARTMNTMGRSVSRR